MDNIEDMMLTDSLSTSMKLPDDNSLSSLRELAEQQLLLEKYVEQKELELVNLKERLTDVREIKIPELLDMLGISEIRLSDSSRLTLKREVFAGITKENQEAAFAWLKKTNNDGIIKNEIKCPFGKGQDEAATKLTNLLNSYGFSFTNTRNVHPQTLKAFVRKQLEGGENISTEFLTIFSVHEKKIAKIEQPK